MQRARSERMRLISLALLNALRIIDAGEALEERHGLGGLVYGPLLILEGLLMQQAGRRLVASPVGQKGRHPA